MKRDTTDDLEAEWQEWPGPLFFDEHADDLDAEWWRICRDAYERLGWGYKKSTRAANEAAADARVSTQWSASSTDRRAKAEGWTKAPLPVRTPDERREQTAAARYERRRTCAVARFEKALALLDLASAPGVAGLKALTQSDRLMAGMDWSLLDAPAPNTAPAQRKPKTKTDLGNIDTPARKAA